MKTISGLAIGFGAGVLALAVFLYSTGRLSVGKTAVAPATQEVAKLPTPPPPDPTLPAAGPVSLPPPPNPALSAGPAETHAMPIDGKLATSTAPANTSLRVIGLPIANLKKDQIRDTFNDPRGGGTIHEATDIIAPRGTPIIAVIEGNVVKLFNSKKGGLTVYQYDNQNKFCYYYAHLDRYAEGLKEGMLLRKGDLLGYVGSTGDAQADNPHLHFAILELGPDRHWYEHTTAINPYPLLMNSLNGK